MTHRVLIVEDDLLNRMLLSTVLQKSGYSIEEVSDGAHAVSTIRQFDPDLITMDINLPNISGLELIYAIKRDEALRHIPVLAVTAYVGRGEDVAIRKAGANELMTKPLSIKPFLTTVQRLLAGEPAAPA